MEESSLPFKKRFNFGPSAYPDQESRSPSTSPPVMSDNANDSSNQLPISPSISEDEREAAMQLINFSILAHQRSLQQLCKSEASLTVICDKDGFQESSNKYNDREPLNYFPSPESSSASPVPTPTKNDATVSPIISSNSSTSASPKPSRRVTAPNSPIFCQPCNKSFYSRTKYQAHIRRHNSKLSGRYECRTCHKCFVQKSSLITHVRIHTGEKPFKCNNKQCKESFSDFSTYTKHVRTHTGEKPYACPICKRAFSQSGNMHRHIKTIHRNEDK